MKLMGFEDFVDKFGRAAKPTMDMSIYRDSFECGCGQRHWFDEGIDIICEGFMKVMVHCPEDPTYVNSLKIKTFMIFKFKGFENLGATRTTSVGEAALVRTVYRAVRMQ